MPTAIGRLEEGRVVVDDEANVNRLWDKGAFGERERGPRQILDPIEAAYLVEDDRLVVEDPDQGRLGVRGILSFCARERPGFETDYLVYRDFRARGLVIRHREDGAYDVFKRGAHPRGQKPATLVSPRAASATTTPRELTAFIQQAQGLGRQAIVSIVDEESDVTHYEVDEATIHGNVPDPAPEAASGARARLLGDRAILLDGEELRAAGYGKETAGEVFCSLAEIHHLVQHGLDLVDADGRTVDASDVLDRVQAIHPDGPLALEAYGWLRAQELIPKTGFKYGVNFRVYRDPIDEAHAPFLVHAAGADEAWSHEELARLARLAHGVRKRPIVFSPSGTITMSWVRP